MYCNNDNSDSVYKSGASFKRYTASIRYNEFSTKVLQILWKNPHGLSLQQVQAMTCLSAKTAKNILARVAIERNNKYYLRG